ncbi:hypothetical protein [Salinibacterium sp. ZJ70]|uniref:hypothetical protein n=1 Tax=Salinibacterium sp. ZJ70 TaxID=2708084 RepID=UPI00141D7AF8|nr:hypothetical protein [Salinibacterium sp. ZJ70]
MEFASYLAGERWSDHPSCTDGTLAALARGVNDLIADSRRDELIPLIPRVVGLTGSDDMGSVVALRSAVVALPIASMERQRVLAAGALALAVRLQRRHATIGTLQSDLQAALSAVPDATRWARNHLTTITSRYPRLDAVSTELIIATAVVGASRACIGDTDGALIEMLGRAVDDAETLVDRTPEPVVTPIPVPQLGH